MWRRDRSKLRSDFMMQQNVLVTNEGYEFRQHCKVLKTIRWDDERAGTQITSLIRDWIFNGLLPE